MGAQVDHIVWHEAHGHIEVVYVGRQPDRIVATQLVAAMLAEDAGLVQVPTPPGLVRWARDPETGDAA